MQTKPKANSVLTHEVSGDAILFKVKDAGELMLDCSKLSEGVKGKALIHGLIQRISDRAAMSRNTSTGLAASPLDKLASMRELVEFYETGTEEWALPRKAGAVGVSLETGFLITALCEVYPERTKEQVSEWVGKRSKEERWALSQSEKLKVIIERLRGEEVVKVDAESLLSELGDEGL
jgi:hypothetical protein